MSMKAEGAEANANAGNMVANAESAEDKWGIKEFNFVLIPGEDTEKSVQLRDQMAEHMSEVLGIPVNTFRATDYNAAVEALRTGNAQLAIVCGWVYDVMEGIFYEGVGGENGFRMEYTEGKCRKEDPFKAVGFRGGCCRSCRKRVYRKSGPDGG